MQCQSTWAVRWTKAYENKSLRRSAPLTERHTQMLSDLFGNSDSRRSRSNKDFALAGALVAVSNKI